MDERKKVKRRLKRRIKKQLKPEEGVLYIVDNGLSGLNAFGLGRDAFKISKDDSVFCYRPCVINARYWFNSCEKKGTPLCQNLPQRIQYKSGEDFCLESFCQKTAKENILDNLVISTPIYPHYKTAYFFTKEGNCQARVDRDPFACINPLNEAIDKRLYLTDINLGHEFKRVSAINCQLITILSTGKYLAKKAHQCTDPLRDDVDRKKNGYRYCPIDNGAALRRIKAYEEKNGRISIPESLKEADRDSIIYTQDAFIQILDTCIEVAGTLACMGSTEVPPLAGCEIWKLVCQFEANDPQFTHFIKAHGLEGYLRYIRVVPCTQYYEDTFLRNGADLYRSDAAMLCLNREGLWSLFYISMAKTKIQANYRQIAAFRQFAAQVAVKAKTELLDDKQISDLTKKYKLTKLPTFPLKYSP